MNETPAFVILLVDDKTENLESLEAILTTDKRTFLKATSGNQALKLALKHEEIGLIMLDVQMPDIDGFEVARMLQSNSKTKDKAIIFVTAINKDVKYVLQGFEEGAVDYLQKPLDVNVTRAKVNVFERLFSAQQQIKNSMLEVERVNRQLEQFVHIVSHDLKSPLATVITLLSILRKEPVIQQHENIQDKIDMVYLSSNQLNEMINSILAYSKQSLSQQVIEEVRTKELLDELIFLLAPPASIRFVIPADLPVLFTRKQKLQQVFQNLISNAIKYMDKPEGIIEIGFIEKDNFYQFYVKDNGPGITKEDRVRIFNLFTTTTNQSQTSDTSTGVGLNILKMLVEEQGGKIWVDSTNIDGSIFYFEWSK